MVSLVEPHVNKKYEEDTTSRTSWICEQSIMKKILLRDVEKNIKKVSLDKWTKHYEESITLDVKKHYQEGIIGRVNKALWRKYQRDRWTKHIDTKNEYWTIY